MSENKEMKMMFLKPAPDKCQVCAVDHDPELPHNPDSLYYQMTFYDQNKRWPGWADAMAHCSQEMKDMWVVALKEKGIEVKL